MVLDNLAKVGKIGLALFVIGAIFFLVGFSIPYWLTSTTNDNVHLGLWQICNKGNCLSTTTSSFKRFDHDGPPGWYRGVQALACLAVITLAADLILRLAFISGKPRGFLIGSVILDVITSVLTFIAAVVFHSKVNEELIRVKFAFGFASDIIGGIFIAGAAACFLGELLRRR